MVRRVGALAIALGVAVLGCGEKPPVYHPERVGMFVGRVVADPSTPPSEAMIAITLPRGERADLYAGWHMAFSPTALKQWVWSGTVFSGADRRLRARVPNGNGRLQPGMAGDVWFGVDDYVTR
jgi:hypothetical protein